MNNKVKREIKDLERQKKKALQRNNLIEAAKFCNLIGETLSSNGLFEEAIEAHAEEIHVSEAANDVIGIAVGNRKAGECLCELNRFEEAIEHQKLHLKLSKSVDNLLEEQRALATLGRTYFVQSDCFRDDEKKFNKCLTQSQKFYLKSLEICNKLQHGTISDNELLEMKARLYLNLGLTYEYKQDIQDALKFVNKALIISREQKLKDDIYRCHYTLSGLHLYDKNYQKALQSAKCALTIAKDGNEKQKEMDALHQMGLILLRLGEFQASLHTLKKVYKSAQKNNSVEEIPVRNLKLAMKGIQLHHKYDSCEDKQEVLSLCEKLGDFYHDIETPEKALDYYLQQCAHANSLGITGQSLAAIYISIAVTYGECKQQENALEFYRKELNLRQGELKEKSSTYCAMAKCMEDLGEPMEEIKATYMKGLECAQGSGDKNAELKVLNDLSETLEGAGLFVEYQNLAGKIKQLKSEISETMECDAAEEGGEQDAMSDDVLGSQSSSKFNSQELQMLESDSEKENDEEEAHLSLNETFSRKKARLTKKKVNKVNERGETPLHLAAIAGNAQRTSELLKQGANVSARDYCGWQPLHEACNHGAVDVVKLLLEHGADVNDPGGAHCGGVTPLHDATQNGHFDVVKLLVSWTANVGAKTKEGYTPLELLEIAIEADNEEFSGSYAEENALLISRKKVEKYLNDVITSNGNQRQTQPADDNDRNSRSPVKQALSSKYVVSNSNHHRQQHDNKARYSASPTKQQQQRHHRRKTKKSRNSGSNLEQNRNKIIFDHSSSSSNEENENGDDAVMRLPFKRQRVGGGLSDGTHALRISAADNDGSSNPPTDTELYHTPLLDDPLSEEKKRNSEYEKIFDEEDHSDNDEEELSPGICTRNQNSNGGIAQELESAEKTNTSLSRTITPRKETSNRLEFQFENIDDTNYRPDFQYENNNSGSRSTATNKEPRSGSANANYRPELQSGNNNRTAGSERHASKAKHPYTRVIQSKIGFPRSPSPSMLDENDVRLQDFIINDMPSAASKNTNKNGGKSCGGSSSNRKQQARIDFSKGTSAGTRNNNNNNHSSKSRKQQKRKWKQKPIGPYTEIHVGDSYSENENDFSANENEQEKENRYNNHDSALAVSADEHNRSTLESRKIRGGGAGARNENLAGPTGPLFRVKVRIAEQCFLIPCQQAGTLTIGWLTEQAVERYHAMSNVSAKLTLKTRDDALLNPNDVVSEVVMNNEELLGEILGFQFPPLLQRYAEQCKQCNTEPLSELLEQFSLEDNFRTLDMKDLFVHAKELQAICSSILCNTSLTCIDLAGIFIGDVNFSRLVPTLHSLPNICTLNLSTTGITGKSLLTISNIVSSQPKEEYKLIMKVSPLSTLRSLQLGYNDFSEEESFSLAMSTILKSCIHLEELNLAQCRLTGPFFQRKQMKDSIKGTIIKCLDLSYNTLGTWNEVVEVVSLFNVSSLEYLDLSSTTSRQNQEKIDLNALMCLFQSNADALQELHLNRLPAISDVGKDVSLFGTVGSNIQVLSVRHSCCSIETFHSLNRHVSQLKHLRSLDFSFSTTFNENHFDCLLQDLRTNNSPLEILKLSSCNICSRLPADIYETLSLWKASSSCRLKSMDLSYNELSTDDRNTLKTCWESMHRTAAYCDMKARTTFILQCST